MTPEVESPPPSAATYDVAVIGYGPTGATAANLLGQMGLGVLVIERDPDVYNRARAISTDEEVMRVWQSVGLADRLQQDMLPDRPLNFVDSDWTMLNARLAKHYGIPHVYGSRFRRVTLAPDSNRGGLLNVGSVAGFLPGPGMAMYYASKAFVLSFTEALRAELGPKGVRVTVLCPGPVQTEFQSRAGYRPGYDPAMLNVSSADVARQGYDGLMANKRAVLPGLGIKMVPFLLRLFPRGFILTAVRMFQLRKR